MHLLLAADHSNPLIPETNELIWGTISFVLLFIVLSRVAFPSLRRTLAERTDRIEGNLKRAEEEYQKAQALLKEYEQKLHEARAEAQRMIAQAHTNAGRLEVELRAKAEDEANRIIERARQAVLVKRDRAITELRDEVGTLAIDLASRVVGESLDRDRHLRLVDRYIEELQG